MTLIKSISGIRGTIEGSTGDNLTPINAVKFAAAYGTFNWHRYEEGIDEVDEAKLVEFEKALENCRFRKRT